MIFTILTLPMLTIFLWDKKHIVSVFIVSLFVLFISINSINAFVINSKVILSIFIVSLIFIWGFLLFKGIKNKKFTKANAINSLKTAAPLYLMLGIIIFIRMWFTRMNTDALYYSNLSQKIKNGIDFQVPVHYQIPSMYSIASIVKRPINFYTVVSDILVLTMISVLIYKIMFDIKDKLDLTFWIFLIAISIVVSLSLPYVTSSLNWVSTSLVALSIIAFRKNAIMLILAPIGLTSFSFSAALFLPVTFIVVLFNKEFTLKEILRLFILAIIFAIIFSLSAFKIDVKVFIFIDFLSIMILLMYFVPEKKISNPIYKINIGNKYNVDKKFKIISLIIVICLFSLLQIGLSFTIWKSNSWTSIFRYRMLLMPLFALAVIECLWKKRITIWLAFFIGFLITGITYYVAIHVIPNRIPAFAFARLMEPLITITLVFCILFLYEKNTQKYIKWNYVFICFSFMLVSINNYSLSRPQYFYSKPSANISRNYMWITNKEWDTISNNYSNTRKKIYSDLPIFAMDKNINSLMNVTDDRELFHSDLFVTMLGRKEYIDDISKDKNYDGIYKITIEYAKKTGDWTEIDKAGIFIFRHKEYANDIVDHYSKYSNKNIKKIGGLFVVQ